MRKPLHTVLAFWITALALSAGCALESLPGPELFEVCLSAEDPCIDEAFAGETTNVALIGDNFYQAFEVDLGTDDTPPVLGKYRAFIGSTEIDDVRRGPDHTDLHVLLGILPGTISLGTHSVVMEVPGGHRSGLPEAFRIVDPLLVTAAPKHIRAPEEHAFELQVTLENQGTALLTQITMRLSQEGAGRVLLPPDTVLTSFSQTTPLRLQAQQQGPVTLALRVTALVGGSVVVGTQEPLTIDMLVLPRAALLATAQVSPAAVGPGERFELIVEVFNTGGTDALDVEVLTPEISGSGAVDLDSPAPPELDIPAGSRRTFRWGGRAQTRGTVVFDARVHGLEATSERLLGPVGADPVSLEIR